VKFSIPQLKQDAQVVIGRE